MVQVFDLGDVVPLTIDIRDPSGALANAGTVTLTITLPDETTASPAVANPTIGRYQVDYVAPQSGRYVIRWVATGTNASAHVDTFEVLPPPFPPWPPLLEDLKADLNISASDTRDDLNLATDLAAARAVVERELKGDFDFVGNNALLSPPSADVLKGTVRLAGRFNARRRSPDGLVDSGPDFGTSRVPRFDADIERMLGVGPYRRPMI